MNQYDPNANQPDWPSQPPTSGTTPVAQPEGWYASPDGSPTLRWWDGQAWTEHVHDPAPQAPAAGSASAAPSYGPQDTVYSQPVQAAQPQVPAAVPFGGQPATPGDVPSASGDYTATAAPASMAKSGISGRGRLAGLAIGVLALCGLGYFAATGIFGSSTGSDAPEQAVGAMMDAMANEDVIAMIETMAPGDVGHASQLYPKVVQIAQREGALEGDEPLRGIDFVVEGLVTRTEQLHPDVAKVYLEEGTISVTISIDQLDPGIRPAFENLDQNEFEVDIAELNQTLDEGIDQVANAVDDLGSLPIDIRISSTEGLYLMTVRQDGDWYVSPTYTIAEMGREILTLPPADFEASRGDAPKGASSPEGIFTGLEEMVNSETLEHHVYAAIDNDTDNFAELAVLLPPNEVGVFLDYGPSYYTLIEPLVEELMQEENITVEELRAQARDIVDEAAVQGQLTIGLDTSVETVDDGLAKVTLDAGRIDLDVSFNAAAVESSASGRANISLDASFEGLCGEFLAQGTAPGEDDLFETDQACIDPLDLDAPRELDGFLQDFDSVFVMASRQNGSWYISYIETGVAYADLLLESIGES